MTSILNRAGYAVVVALLALLFVVGVVFAGPQVAHSLYGDKPSTPPSSILQRVGTDPVPDGYIPKAFQPCRGEDGPGPCYWDAGVRGNGQGKSYVIKNGRTYYIDGSERIN